MVHSPLDSDDDLGEIVEMSVNVNKKSSFQGLVVQKLDSLFARQVTIQHSQHILFDSFSEISTQASDSYTVSFLLSW